jgi:hypothetical protein
MPDPLNPAEPAPGEGKEENIFVDGQDILSVADLALPTELPLPEPGSAGEIPTAERDRLDIGLSAFSLEHPEMADLSERAKQGDPQAFERINQIASNYMRTVLSGVEDYGLRI